MKIQYVNPTDCNHQPRRRHIKLMKDLTENLHDFTPAYIPNAFYFNFFFYCQRFAKGILF